MTCPLLFMANKSSQIKEKTNNYNCHQEECTWFDNKERRCKLTESKYMSDYVKKTMQCI
ncbi:hypothetical protein JCM16358_09390 [Halanaerocella petrolearia]